MKKGDTVAVHLPQTQDEHESWMQGEIMGTLNQNHRPGVTVFVVRCDRFKWDWDAEWGPYDGLPFCIAWPDVGNGYLEFIDIWPRTGPRRGLGPQRAETPVQRETENPT